MSSHGGGRRNNSAGGRYYGSSSGGRGRGGQGSSGSAPPNYNQERTTVDYLKLGPQQQGTIFRRARPPTAASTASSSTATATSPPPVSSQAVVNITRPGFGITGEKCMVRANHFLVEMNNTKIFHYDIKIIEEGKSEVVNSKKKSREVMKKLFEQFGASQLRNRKAVYDGRLILYTAKRLPFESMDFEVNLPEKNKPNQYKMYSISIRFIKELYLDHLLQFLSARQLECPYDVIAALDVVLSESFTNSHVMVSRSFFSPDHKEFDDRGFEYWRGFFQSLRPTQMGLSLNVDIQATPFYMPINLKVFFWEYLKKNPKDENITREEHIKIEWVSRGVRVESTHMRDKKIRYKITGITEESAEDLIFTLDGTETSVATYFRDHYPNASINYKLPCIKAGSDNNPKYLPIQVCEILNEQRYIKKLNSDHLSKLLNMLSKWPIDRERDIFQMVRGNNYNNDQYVREFGLSVEPKLVTFEARLLPAPMLKFNEKGKVKEHQPRDGQWTMKDKRLLDGVKVDYWAYINFSDVLKGDVMRFLKTLVDECNEIGMDFNPLPAAAGNKNSKSREEIEVYLRDFHMQYGQLQLLIVILPEVKGSLYGMIKTICETQLGIVTQCCQPDSKKISKPAYCKNLALKINVKVAGCNNTLAVPSPLISDIPTIVFGADVNHSSPGDDSPSIAAVVASMDWPYKGKYKALVSAQPRGREIIADLYKVGTNDMGQQAHEGMIRDLIRDFQRKTKQIPKRIIFYRDGVSEGQFRDVLLFEITAIQKACKSIAAGYEPSITFIVVQKRHHTRLFPADNKKDSNGNICPGTVVDKYICHPTDFDFYLCSHASIKGTSRPAHYVVLHDDSKFSADQLQNLTNDLCYTYARCTRSVSVAPPALYAHLAAFRGRYYMDEKRRRRANSGTVPAIIEKVKDVMFFC